MKEERPPNPRASRWPRRLLRRCIRSLPIVVFAAIGVAAAGCAAGKQPAPVETRGTLANPTSSARATAPENYWTVRQEQQRAISAVVKIRGKGYLVLPTCRGEGGGVTRRGKRVWSHFLCTGSAYRGTGSVNTTGKTAGLVRFRLNVRGGTCVTSDARFVPRGSRQRSSANGTYCAGGRSLELVTPAPGEGGPPPVSESVRALGGTQRSSRRSPLRPRDGVNGRAPSSCSTASSAAPPSGTKRRSRSPRPVRGHGRGRNPRDHGPQAQGACGGGGLASRLRGHTPCPVSSSAGARSRPQCRRPAQHAIRSGARC